MPTIDGISCAILTSDGSLPEYPCMPEMGDLYARSASAYIQGTPNQRFTIKVTCDSSVLRKAGGGGAAMGISCLPVIDGVAEPSVVILPPLSSSSSCAGVGAHRRSGGDGGKIWESNKFVFSPLGPSAPPSSSSSCSPHPRQQGVITLGEAKELGTVIVRLKYFRGGLPNEGDRAGSEAVEREGGRTCLKKSASGRKRVGDGGGDGGDGDELRESPQRRRKSTHLGPYPDKNGSDSLVIFHFVYKSQRALEYMGFLPCPDGCLSPAFPRPLDDGDDDRESVSGEYGEGEEETEDTQLSEGEEDEEGDKEIEEGIPSDQDEDGDDDDNDGGDGTSPQILETEEEEGEDAASRVGEGEDNPVDPPPLATDQGDDDEDEEEEIAPPTPPPHPLEAREQRAPLGQETVDILILRRDQEDAETPPEKPLAGRKRSRSPLSPERIKRRSTRSRTRNPLGVF